jgi:alkanesulfonate monooxygenase
MMSEGLHFGWFIPTQGDTPTPGDPSKSLAPSLESFVGIAKAAERAGFEYALVPVQTMCYEAWITCAMISAQTEHMKMLVAIRAGFIAPTVMAKMFTTFDQLSQGRIYANLIAGGGAAELAADGCYHAHDERYEVMDETVTLMKRCWTEPKKFDHEGRFFKAEGVRVFPRPYQQPHPPFYLGGMSEAAKEVSAKHAHVHLFWGDTPERIAGEIADLRKRAAAHGREGELRFGMRLQVVVRETEEEAWAAANGLIEGASDRLKETTRGLWEQSEANTRMKRLGEVEDFKIAPHLWSGITTVRPGAGVAVVGSPAQVGDTLQQFIDIGCTDFCLSGYLHDEEAERFGRLVMPRFEHLRAVAAV